MTEELEMRANLVIEKEKVNKEKEEEEEEEEEINK
jgi:hypothetical protein